MPSRREMDGEVEEFVRIRLPSPNLGIWRTSARVRQNS